MLSDACCHFLHSGPAQDNVEELAEWVERYAELSAYKDEIPALRVALGRARETPGRFEELRHLAELVQTYHDIPHGDPAEKRAADRLRAVCEVILGRPARLGGDE